MYVSDDPGEREAEHGAQAQGAGEQPDAEDQRKWRGKKSGRDRAQSLRRMEAIGGDVRHVVHEVRARRGDAQHDERDRNVHQRGSLAEDLGRKWGREHERVLDPLTRTRRDDDCMEECDRAMPRTGRRTELDRRRLHRLKTATKSRWSGTR